MENDYAAMRQRIQEQHSHKRKETDLAKYLQRMVPILELEVQQGDPVQLIRSVDVKSLCTHVDILLTLPMAEWKKRAPRDLAYDLAKGIAIMRHFNPNFGSVFGLK